LFAKLTAKGLRVLPANASAAYYRAVLSTERPAEVDHRLAAKQLMELVDEGNDPIQPLDATGVFVQEPMWNGCLEDDPAFADDVDPEDIIDPDLDIPLPPALNSAGRPRRGPTTESSSCSSSDDGSPSESGAGGSSSSEMLVCRRFFEPEAIESRARLRLAPSFIEGQKVKVEKHTATQHYCRIGVICNRCDIHEGRRKCFKWRNVGQAQYLGLEGIDGPVAFLRCWLQKSSSFASRVAHIRYNPSLEECLGIAEDS
jgi:hypothetical protein